MIVNAAWPAANESAVGANPAKSDRERQQEPGGAWVLVADHLEQPGADDDSGHGAAQALHHGLAGAQGVRAQDRERPEHDPERVLDSREIGDEDGETQSDRASHAVVQPDRVALDVRRGAFLRH